MLTPLRSDLEAIGKERLEALRWIRAQTSLVQTNTMNKVLTVNPITVITKFIPEDIILQISSTQKLLSAPIETQISKWNQFQQFNSVFNCQLKSRQLQQLQPRKEFESHSRQNRTEIDPHDESYQENSRIQMRKGKKRLKSWSNLQGSGSLLKWIDWWLSISDSDCFIVELSTKTPVK